MANNKPITIIIHGTWFPLISSFIHKMNCPYGITKGIDLSKKTIWSKIPHILSNANPELFPLESIYVFGWSGKLNFNTREKTAKTLYEILLQHNGPINIIGHSHGGNIALNLAKIDQMRNKISIEKLILIACPVQYETAKFVDSPIFKNVYHFYSDEDIAQIIDPQKLNSKYFFNSDIPFLSQRKFASTKVLQASVQINNKALKHNDFLNEIFLSKLSEMLNIMETKKNKVINLAYALS